jgi:TPR repeat protein
MSSPDRTTLPARAQRKGLTPQKLLAVAFAVLMLVETAAPASADAFEDALNAFNAADYAQAYAIWWRLAKEGDAKAQASLGFMYYSGKGVRRDDEQSLYWFRQAADAGQPTAQFFLGMQYFQGRGVPRNLAEAYSWCDIALSNGYSPSLSCRDAVGLKMTPEDQHRAAELTAEFFRTHEFRN